MGRRWEDYELEMIRKVPRGELRKVAQQIGRSYAAVCLKRDEGEDITATAARVDLE